MRRNSALLQTFDGHRSIVEDGDFIDNGTRVVTVGDDGNLFALDWVSGRARSLFTQPKPLTALEVLPTSNEIVVQNTIGAVWVVTSAGAAKQIRLADNVDIRCMRASGDGTLLGIGMEDGNVVVYRTHDWAIVKSLRTRGGVARIEFDPKERDMLVYSEDGVLQLESLDSRRDVPWRTLKVEAHDLTYSPSGDIIAISALEGGTWFYSRSRASWSYRQDHDTEVWVGQFTPDERRFISIDRDGRIITRDISSIYDTF